VSGNYSVPIEKLIAEFSLTPIWAPEGCEKNPIESCEVNRPGLQMTGYVEGFENSRIQVLGYEELNYLDTLSPAQRSTNCDRFFALGMPLVVVTRGLTPPEEIVSGAKKHGVPLYSSKEQTSAFMASLISLLNVELAPRITTHGVLVEVIGEGVLIIGDSGVGKSETAIELVRRGHRLIADDAVEIRRVSSRTLVGTSPENIRHFLELRGVGVVNVRRLYGMGSVKQTEKIDLVIEMEQWDPDKIYDRMGIDNNEIDILGVRVPSVTIPVRPGRNLAIIIETAAMNSRDKKFGYNPTKELLSRLGMDPEEFENDQKTVKELK